MKSDKKAYLFAGLSVLFWAPVATAFKVALREFDFIQLIFFASGITVIFLFLLLLIQGKFISATRQSKKQWISSLLLGSLNPLAYYLILFKAYSLLPAQLAQPLNMIWPIVLALFSVPLLKQRIGWISFLALFINFAGVVFITSQGGAEGFANTNFTGVALALGSSVIWSLYWIFNVRDKRDEIVKLFWSFVFGFVFLALAVFLFSDFKIQTGESLWALIYVGIFEAGITYVFWLKALTYSTNNAKTGNLVFLTPFLSLLFIHFILKETIFITTFIGLILIVSGILFQQLDKTNRRSV